jgi:hypothetical protein
VDGTATAGIADIEVATPVDITGTATITPDTTAGTVVALGVVKSSKSGGGSDSDLRPCADDTDEPRQRKKLLASVCG